jgi:superkiller protein 3
LTSFARAAQLNPSFDETFVYIGHYYSLVEGDDTRAMKCYQKAFLLNPRNGVVGKLLAALYEDRGDHDAAFYVYRTIADHDSRAHWAWKRLGFIYMVDI